MDVGMIVSIMQRGITMVILLSAPMLIIGLVTGLLISIFQATTQIQEATLSFVPKIVAVLLSIVIFGPWIISTLLEFTKELFMNLNNYIQ